MLQKSYAQSNNGKLYLIPTPIGNMEDITLRAISTLKEVDVIFAEDTRITNILLTKHNINKKVYSCHKYSEEKNKEKIIKLLLEGKNIAIVTDRGTPLISDPGSVIVNYAIENNIDVISLPGPSALLPALNMSGLSNERFLFYGFLNTKEQKIKKELDSIKDLPYTIIFYESPHRLQKTLTIMKDSLGNRKISIAREISKLHEEIFRGTISEAINAYETVKGEIVIILEGKKEQIEKEINYELEVEKLIKEGCSTKDAVKQIATKYNISKNKLYNQTKER
ncbi:MAG: 16S rRNA (cytidine(1402)-2'-O)-methyltransferase [Bacilli bacterium]|nr:16S rRNA (cytidine(1402)-2'-O)-methyltransferase [Bacilli bacterium]